MRGRLPLALFAILLGAVDTAAGPQEVVFLGILQSQTEVLIVGSVGTVASALLLAGGIALLIQSSLTDVLITSEQKFVHTLDCATTAANRQEPRAITFPAVTPGKVAHSTRTFIATLVVPHYR
jgi:hypothetical protein